MKFGNPRARSINISIEFELEGEFQGVYFLNNCKEEGTKLGLCGWVKYGKYGTIIGILQGKKPKVEEMIVWLKETGAPGSRVDNCYLSNYRYLPRLEYNGFTFRC